MKRISIYLVTINVITYFLYAEDKRRAKQEDAWRIPERVLLNVTAIGGSVGALIAMKVYHHKVRKVKFYLGVPLIFLIHVVILFCYLYLENRGIKM